MTSVKDRRKKRDSICPLDSYLYEIDSAPLLSPEDEHELADRIAAGDAAARDRMVRANLRLVVNLARRYAGRGLPMEDLIAEGNLGLLRAVEGYDPTAGTRFSTYASFWIKQSIRRALSMTGRVVRLPHYVGGLIAKWRQVTAAMNDELGRAPSEDEVAGRLGLSAGERRAVKKGLRVNASFQSSDDAEGPAGLAELVADGRAVAADDRLALIEDLELAIGSLNRLDEREVTVLRLRFGLGDDEPRTLQEVGERIGCTRERARQIERDALAKLRGCVPAA